MSEQTPLNDLKQGIKDQDAKIVRDALETLIYDHIPNDYERLAFISDLEDEIDAYGI